MTVVDTEGVLLIRMTQAEAISTALSLLTQVKSNSPNIGRLETYLDEDGRDFSIAVMDDENDD